MFSGSRTMKFESSGFFVFRTFQLKMWRAEYFKTFINLLLLCALVGRGQCFNQLKPRGYINIDCGGTGGKDPVTGLDWVTDEGYLVSADRLFARHRAIPANVTLGDDISSSRNNANQLGTAMVFIVETLPSPQASMKFCYTFNLSLSNAYSTNYLIRAVFPNATKLTSRDNGEDLRVEINGSTSLYLSVDSTLVSYIYSYPLTSLSGGQTQELFATSSIGDYMHICLVSMGPGSLMAISSLELRSLPEKMYPLFDDGKLDASGSPITGKRTTLPKNYFSTSYRLNFGGNESSPVLRYPFDQFDRLWYGAPITGMTTAGSRITPKRMDVGNVSSETLQDDIFQIPPAVVASAWEGVDLDALISILLDLRDVNGGLVDPQPTYCLSFVLLDVDPHEGSGSSRAVDIYNADIILPSGASWQWFVQNADVPKTKMRILHNKAWQFDDFADSSVFNISRAQNSTLPVMVNAFELYSVKAETSKTYFPSELNLRTFLHNLSSNIDTSGDPCLPVPWFWLKCTLGETYSSGVKHFQVEEMNLSSQGLAGELPQFPVGLAVIDLSNNSFSGTLDPIMAVNDIRKLDLSMNNFVGSLQNTVNFGSLDTRSLEFLNLSSNYMSGDIMIFADTDENSENQYPLRALDLSDNNFTGTIPVFKTKSLEFLNLSSNHMSGNMSVLFHKLQPLTTLSLEKNNFSGMIPDDIWTSTSQLQTVDLSYNSFTKLNLTSWCQALVKNQSFRGFQRVNMISNRINEVILGGRDAVSFLQSTEDFAMYQILQRSTGHILLGGNEWCEKPTLSEAIVLKRYMCRHSELEDYYLKYLILNPASSKKNLIIGLSVGGSVVCLISCILLFFLGRMWKRMKHLHQIQEELAKEDVRPPFYKYEELRTATGGFSQKNELGRGGFGAVYKAVLADNSTVAVKLLFPMKQNLADFLKEAVLITGIKHKHLIQLKGCCVRDRKRMLIYEYAENRNLAQALWGGDGTFILSWSQRLKIAVGVAKGLSYLHEELQPKIIHRDIKPQNILLDKDWNAKIADFGLARPVEGDDGTQATRLGGTLGYLAPEYASQGLLTEKLDVYSYGILLMEIVTGRRCIDNSAPVDQFYLRNWALKLYREGCLSRMAEKSMLEAVPVEDIVLVLTVALLCVKEDHEKRPSMSQVVHMLTGNSSSVAVDIVDELKDQQILYEPPYETSTFSSYGESQGREDQVLLTSASLSDSSGFIELSNIRAL